MGVSKWARYVPLQSPTARFVCICGAQPKQGVFIFKQTPLRSRAGSADYGDGHWVSDGNYGEARGGGFKHRSRRGLEEVEESRDKLGGSTYLMLLV